MKFHTTLKLGPNREVLPNGFVLFKDVSIARTGEQIYGPGETAIAPGPDGLVYIDRPAKEVFRAETIASANGVTFTNDHPPTDVTPENWRELAHGFILHPRRGSGEQKDELVGDLLVTSPEAVRELDSGKREVSAGYDADYFETGPGRGEQRNIVLNHVALVDAGRCGSRCAIRDQKTQTGACHMKTLKERFLDAFKSKDEAEFTKVLGEVKDEPVAIHVHTADGAKAVDAATEARIAGLEATIAKMTADKAAADKKAKDDEEAEAAAKKKKEEEEKTEDDEMEDELGEEAPEGDEEEAKKAKDSAYLVDSFDNVKMLAEIIAPGVKIPTFDRTASPKITFKDCICGLRRKALQLGTHDASTSVLIDQARGRTTDSKAIIAMPCGAVRMLFNSVATLKKNANNTLQFTDNSTRRSTTTETAKSPMQAFKDASAARWSNKK